MRLAFRRARLGGDEFAVLVPNIDAKSDITRLMQLIISSMRQPLEIGGQAITLVFPADCTCADPWCEERGSDQER